MRHPCFQFARHLLLAMLTAAFLVSALSAQASDDEAQHPSKSGDAQSKVTAIEDNLQRVVQHYRQGDAKAARDLLHETYEERFEGIEGDLIEQDADLVTDLEKDFNQTLPNLMKQDVSADKFSAGVDQVTAKLDRAKKMLADSDQDHGKVFGDD